MSPRHQLALNVAIIAAVITVAWVVLFRSHALAPSVTVPAGPSLPEIGKQFDTEIERLNRLLEPATNGAPAMHVPPVNTTPAPQGASDDVRAPVTP